MTDQSLYNRLFLSAAMAATLAVTGCSAPQATAPKAAYVKTTKTSASSAAKPVAPAASARISHRPAVADKIETASMKPRAAGLAGGTWSYEYQGKRGTITYNTNGTFAYQQQGLRSGTGRWEMRDGKFCQTVSGSRDRCVSLRQEGKAFYIGNVKLTPARG
jgi:hypothetical protein